MTKDRMLDVPFSFADPITLTISGVTIRDGSLPDVAGSLGGGLDPTIDPQLYPLADNGGWSRTHALRLGSPALDGATCTDIGRNTVYYDQRSYRRPRIFAVLHSFSLQGGARSPF